MSALTDILARFDNPKPSGGQFLVRCSAHEDRSPSLAIREADDGSVLLKCHAGCQTESILASLGLETSALFPPKNGNGSYGIKRDVVATYDYTDESGALLFQAVRYSPKGFSQRAPDGAGGWKFSLTGVRRVLYKLPELKGHPAILLCEGEKDVEAALKLGVPATCNPMGAGKWIEDYTEQLFAIGVKRVAIVPDNDDPGRAHAAHVARSCHKAGLAVRIATLEDVPEKGDLSDYLVKHSKADLLALVREAPLWSPHEIVTPAVDKEFSVLGESRYGLIVHSAGVTFEIDRLRRDREGLTGELAVSVNGLFPLAKHHHGVISIGDFNCASVQARSTRAKLLAERSGDKETDWYGLLEEFVTDVMATERKGQPAVVLADALPDTDESSEVWDVEGFPVLQELPMVLFGDSSSGKSYFAMWVAGVLATRDISVLYADWEFSQKEHRRRLERLFQPMPKRLHYVRCEAPLVRDADRLTRMVREYDCQYVICDSIGFAVEGAAETHDAARGYFRGLRQLGVGTLSIAHIPAQTEEGKDPKIFGSTFFKAGARSAWYIERAHENPEGEIRFGLHHRKTNVGALLASRAYKLAFGKNRTTVESIDLEAVDELSVQLPMIQRIRKHLSEVDAPMSVKKLAEELASTPNIIRATIAKHKSTFMRLGDKVALKVKPGEMQF